MTGPMKRQLSLLSKLDQSLERLLRRKLPPHFTACWLQALIIVILGSFTLMSCAPRYDDNSQMVVSVADQRMLLIQNGQAVKTYPISTSKYGLGSATGSNKTPTGRMKVARKIGDGARPGTVFKSRKPTGEILRPNAPGRDPIVSRILWLTGTEPHNRNTYRRYIYIHGTPQEQALGQAASYGCIRMASRDVIDLYQRIGVGAEVLVTTSPLPKPKPQEIPTQPMPSTPPNTQLAGNHHNGPVNDERIEQNSRRTAGKPAGRSGI